MLKQDIEKRLKDSIDLCEKKLFLERNPYQVYISLSQFNEIYRKITGKYYVDEDIYENRYPYLLKKVFEICDDKLIEIASNCLDFQGYCGNELPNILDNTIDLLESNAVPSCEFTDIDNSDIRPLIKDYFKYVNLESKELFNHFYKNNYLINIDSISDEFLGVIYFDLLGKEDYIFVGTKDRCNLDIAATNIHEFGHADDVKNLDRKTKYKYVLLSPYIEVSSHLMQNKFYDYLIDENINKEFAVMEKYDLIEDSIYKLSNCVTFFDALSKGEIKNDIDISKFIKYGFGQFISICLLNDKESLDMFKKCHHNIFDSSLLNKLSIDEEKCNKVFTKEIDKIYK